MHCPPALDSVRVKSSRRSKRAVARPCEPEEPESNGEHHRQDALVTDIVRFTPGPSSTVQSVVQTDASEGGLDLSMSPDGQWMA